MVARRAPAFSAQLGTAMPTLSGRGDALGAGHGPVQSRTQDGFDHVMFAAVERLEQRGRVLQGAMVMTMRPGCVLSVSHAVTNVRGQNS